MLRLVTSTVVVSVAHGGAAATQTVEAYNKGDGALSLSLKSSVSWLVPTVGTARTCTSTTLATSCLPLQFALSTASMASGSQTGIVTVSDSAAVDAPQTITVTVQVDGGVPTSITAYVAAGGTREVTFTANSTMGATVTTQDGGSWLSGALLLDSVGSFAAYFPYTVRLTPPSTMAAGAYTGSLAIAGSSLAADNKTVPVTLNVTAQPVAQASTTLLALRLAQGSPAYTSTITVSNVGAGTLTVQSATATLTSCASWLTATSYAGGGKVPGGVVLTVDPSALSVGTCSASVAIVTNAAASCAAHATQCSAGGTVTVPVQLDVLAKDVPSIPYQGVLDNGTYTGGDTVARGDVMIVKGEQLTFSSFAQSAAAPLNTVLGSTSVLVNGVAAPLYYASALYGQLAFQMPVDASLGTALVQVQRDGSSTSNTVSVTVAERAPRIVRSGVGDYGVVTNSDGSWVMPTGAYPGVTSRPATAGDWLTIWCIGLGPTSPVVASGAPAPSSEPLARTTTTPTVSFRTGTFPVSAIPAFAGLTPTYAGLYQVNVQVPADAPKGDVYLSVGFSDASSNEVLITIQ